MKYALLFLVLLPLNLLAFSPEFIHPETKQYFIFYQSDQITAGGLGGGLGIQFDINKNVFMESDIGILWGNGNSIPVSITLGIQKDGFWCPALSSSLFVLMGQKTVILDNDGSLPSDFLYAGGIKIHPLRFKSDELKISVLEFGYGLGPYKGSLIYCSILSAEFW